MEARVAAIKNDRSKESREDEVSQVYAIKVPMEEVFVQIVERV
jgi:hypothetical protein